MRRAVLLLAPAGPSSDDIGHEHSLDLQRHFSFHQFLLKEWPAVLKEAVDAAPQATSIQQQAKVLHPMRQRNRVRIARKRTLAKVQRKHIQQDQKYLEDYFAKKRQKLSRSRLAADSESEASAGEEEEEEEDVEEDEEEEEEEVEDEDSDASPFTLQPLNASKPALSRIFYSPPQGSSVPHASLSPTTPSPTKQKKGDESMPPLSLSDEAYAERLSRMIVPQRKASQNAQKYLAGNARIEEDSSSNKIGLPRLASSPFLLALPTPLQLTAQTFSDAKSHPDPYLRRNHGYTVFSVHEFTRWITKRLLSSRSG